VVAEILTKRSVRVVEVIVTIVILLVIVQTFLEDYTVIAEWDEDFRTILLYTGFFFDFFFTIEFLTRLYNGLSRKRALFYLVHQRGWIDFLASVPLLMLSSGPPLIAQLFGGAAILGTTGILNMLKLIKAIRIARILRLLRILKIFKSIKHTESVMAQRHVAKIITVSVTVVVFALFVYSGLSQWIDVLGPSDTVQKNREGIIDLVVTDAASSEAVVAGWQLVDDSLLLVKKDARLLYSRYGKDYYEQNLEARDYTYLESGTVAAYFDTRAETLELEQNQSWQSLFFFALILLIVLSYLIFYGPHFAVTVTDPLHVMKRGLSEKDYNLEVKIPETYEGDDIFELARLYNEKYLPMKDLTKSRDNTPDLSLKVDDLKDMFE
jgi:hypothetical protein